MNDGEEKKDLNTVRAKEIDVDGGGGGGGRTKMRKERKRHKSRERERENGKKATYIERRALKAPGTDRRMYIKTVFFFDPKMIRILFISIRTTHNIQIKHTKQPSQWYTMSLLCVRKGF